MTVVPRFHLAFPVRDLDETRAFYGDLLECNEGRSSAEWVDFDFFGHRIATYLSAGFGRAEEPNSTGDAKISDRHFGIVLDTEKWRILPAKFRKTRAPFPVEPGLRFAAEAGGQATIFAAGPSGNALEFKAFARQEQIFAR
jgi:extradiol dioxygenase family protein